LKHGRIVVKPASIRAFSKDLDIVEFVGVGSVRPRNSEHSNREHELQATDSLEREIFFTYFLQL
jgi:hypothetical protein